MIYRGYLKFLFIAGCVNYAAIDSVLAQNARIRIDVDHTLGEVNKHIYGNFV